MAWIRLDCATLDDDFCIEKLTAEEFKAWILFLLRIKAIGARGSAPVASLCSLARNWQVSSESITSMLSKAGDRITEENGRWHVKNWRKYQEDYDKSITYEGKRPSSEKPEDGAEATTVHHSTVHHSTPHNGRAPTIFKPPTLEEIKTHFLEQKYINPESESERFFNHYEANGWFVGKNKMRKWRSAAANWNKNAINWSKPNGTNRQNGSSNTVIPAKSKYANVGNRSIQPDASSETISR